LGKKQSGRVKEVGLDLFCELLADAVCDLKGDEDAAPRRASCEMKVSVSAFIPEEYLPDIGLRLAFYKRFATADTRDALDGVFDDLVDRFGKPPQPILTLFELTGIKIDCQALGLKSFSLNQAAVAFQLTAQSPLAPLAVAWVQSTQAQWRLTPDGVLTRGVSRQESQAGLQTAHAVVAQLAAFVAAQAN
jgi:transcription-repair coupling factor (superfamily II helicase)